MKLTMKQLRSLVTEVAKSEDEDFASLCRLHGIEVDFDDDWTKDVSKVLAKKNLMLADEDEDNSWPENVDVEGDTYQVWVTPIKSLKKATNASDLKKKQAAA